MRPLFMLSCSSPFIVNVVLITAAFSAVNTIVFSASRILYGLVVQSKAPKIFTTCTQGSLPWVAVIAAVCTISAKLYRLFDPFIFSGYFRFWRS